MKLNQNVQKEIRKHWYGNHTAEISGESGLQVLSWEEPGNSIYRIKYVLSGNNVFVSGDLGEAVYNLTCPATLENIQRFDLAYFNRKLSAFCGERWDFDNELAKLEFDEYWAENDLKNRFEDSQKIYDAIIAAVGESPSLETYQANIMATYRETSLKSDQIESIWEFGKAMPVRLIGYWVGLQMAIEQLLNEEDFFKTMSLVGGIDMYSIGNKRVQTEEKPYGRKVRFLSRNGYDRELKEAQSYFRKDQILTVNEIYVGGSSSEVEFVEVPDIKFNTVMFTDLKE